MKRAKLSALARREIALAAMVAEKTLLKCLLGEPVRPMGRERVRRVLAEMGLEYLLPKS